MLLELFFLIEKTFIFCSSPAFFTFHIPAALGFFLPVFFVLPLYPMKVVSFHAVFGATETNVEVWTSAEMCINNNISVPSVHDILMFCLYQPPAEIRAVLAGCL